MVAQCRWGKECAFLAGFRCRFGHKTSDIADLSLVALAKRQLEIERRLSNYMHRLAPHPGPDRRRQRHLEAPQHRTQATTHNILSSIPPRPTHLPLRRPNRYKYPSPAISLVLSPALHLLNLVPL